MRTEQVALTVRVALDVEVVEIGKRRGRTYVILESEGKRYSVREGDTLELVAEVKREGTTGTWRLAA